MKIFSIALTAVLSIGAVASPAPAHGRCGGFVRSGYHVGGYGYGGYGGYDCHRPYFPRGCNYLPCGYRQWGGYCYFPSYRCYGYYCPQYSCWYYYCPQYHCYLPVDYIQQYQPQQQQLNTNQIIINNHNNNTNTNNNAPTGAVPISAGVPLP